MTGGAEPPPHIRRLSRFEAAAEAVPNICMPVSSAVISGFKILRKGEGQMESYCAKLNRKSYATGCDRSSRKVNKFPAIALVLVIANLTFISRVSGQQYDSAVYSGMQWRLIGPHRAGRVTTVAGIPGQPAIYYFGTPGGGLWKTTSGGRVWQPIFDDTHQAAIGALALAPSNPNIIYVGTGEQVQGNGVYKSTDGGSTWTNIGLTETNSISSLLVDAQAPKFSSLPMRDQRGSKSGVLVYPSNFAVAPELRLLPALQASVSTQLWPRDFFALMMPAKRGKDSPTIRESLAAVISAAYSSIQRMPTWSM